jgi:hypothetical protein
MDTQPDLWGYQALDAADNVSLVSGKFNYSVPITSIPEFPMAVGYSGDAGMDQEASAFGLGFNSFPGSITRSVNGLPDDLNGSKDGGRKVYAYGNEPVQDMNKSSTVTLGLSQGDYFSTGVSFSHMIGFNNYSGYYGALSVGLGLTAGIKKSNGEKNPVGNLGIGISYTNDSRETVPRFGAGAGLSIAGISLANAYASKKLDNSKWDKGSSVIGKSLTQGSSEHGNSSVSSGLASLAYVFPNRNGYTTSLNPSIFICGCSFSINVSKYKFIDNRISKTGYGFMYLDEYSQASGDHLADMSIEGEDSFNENARNTPSYLQVDNYSVNTMGLSGAMGLYQQSYGVVSRNHVRQKTNKRRATLTSTEINEVNPWYDVKQSSINKSVDIIGMLKTIPSADLEEMDFTDNAASIMSEQTLVTFNDNSRKFDEKPEFKMRGDMAGEYDLSSSSYTDDEINSYSLTHVAGTSSSPQFALLGVERNVPLYFPSPHRNYQQYADNNDIKKSTFIKKHTVGEILNSLSALLIADPEGSGSASTLPIDPFNFSNSFYTHYKYDHTDNTAGNDVDLNTDISKINILDHLSDLRNQSLIPSITLGGTVITPPAENSYFNDLVGSIEVQSENGLKYYFNLPVFNKTSRNLQLLGKGPLHPEIADGDYHSYYKDGSYYERNKLAEENGYMYPYAWMLTAIVGDDYIDFDNIPGPSDGDIGYWVKFKYVRTAENYRWRAPFTGMDHFPGLLHKYDDDGYFASSGTKEIYHISEIESANYKCRYNYHKRFDGAEASGFVNGDAKNSLTESPYTPVLADLGQTNYQFVVTQIDLFKKHSDGNNSAPITEAGMKIIKSTKFSYDYALCPSVPNNFSNYITINKSTVPYHIDYDTEEETGTIETGKLTLRKIQHIAYDETGNIASATYLPSYNFKYYGDDAEPEDYNPVYNKNMFDQWGNYFRGASDGNYYEHYTEYVKAKADINSRVYKLKTINLPSGGSMDINYEAQTYGFVEDKTPFAMRHIENVELDESGQARVKVDVTDLAGVGLEAVTTTTSLGDEKPIVSVDDKLYGEIAFYRSHENSGHSGYRSKNHIIMINEEAKVVDLETPVWDSGLQKWLQVVVLTTLNNGTYYGSPFVTQCKDYMYGESAEMRALKDDPDPAVNCTSVLANFESKYENLYHKDLEDVVTEIIGHGNNMLKAAPTMRGIFDGCFGEPGTELYSHWSFLRTPVYRAKYTGSVVSSLVMKDNFQYATQDAGTSFGTVEDENYGSVYHYDLKGDGNSTSAGVATSEPGGGKSCVIDVLKTTGGGFMHNPSVISSKTTLENLYHADDPTPDPGDKISRKKGKTSYEFYTPKDDGLQFGDHFKEKKFTNYSSPISGNFFLFGIFSWLVHEFTIFGKEIVIKIPFYIPMHLRWDIEDKYHIKSYAYTDYTDIYGRVKAIRQIDAAGQEIGIQKHNYYSPDAPIDVYNKSFSGIDPYNKRPGKMDQVWSESYYTRRDDISLIYPLMACNASTKKDFSYTNMKYSYVPPVLKEVVSTIDGLTTTTEYTGFDYYTGSPVEAKSDDSYGNTKISRSVPAYWEYDEMGPRCENDNYVNNLTAITGTYMYLNSVSSESLIGAGVVKWTDNNSTNSWNIGSYLQPQMTYVSAGTYKYMYNEVAGSNIKDKYNPGYRGADRYIQRNAYLFKPYKGYTYEVPLNTNGTFKTFASFNYLPTATNAKWKEISTNDLYSQNGVLLQSRDALSKYASQLLGYNFSNTIAAVSNASWGASAYDGAENTYLPSTGSTVPMLESNKVKLQDASVVENCDPEFESRTLTTASFPHSGPTFSAKVLNITLPTIPQHNVPFAKVDITYSGTGIVRSLYVSLNDHNRFQVFSNVGETFDGFFVYPQIGGTYKLLFKASDFTSFTLDNSFTTSGHTVSYAAESGLTDCDLSKPYQVPLNDCHSVHTGSYAFSLAPEKTGTEFLISANAGGNVTATEFKRRYKALVWVHNTSPSNTELVVRITNSAGSGGTLLTPEIKTSKATPYVTAGEWSLLRVDFNLGNLHISGTPYVHVFVRNASENGMAIYDDYRVLPFNADMTNWVFDHKFNRVISGLDVDNFASYSYYDNRGRVKHSKVELQGNGKTTVQKFLYNDQKTN